MTRPPRVPQGMPNAKVAHSKDVISPDFYTKVGTQVTCLRSSVDAVPLFSEAYDSRAVDLSQEWNVDHGQALAEAAQRVMLFS